MSNIYYEKENFKLYNWDIFEVLKNFKENSVDMIFADPPYFLSSWSFSCQNWKMVSVKKWNWDLCNWIQQNFDFHLKWIKECKRILKENGTIWISWTYHSIYQCWYALQLQEYHILNDIAWLKPNASPNLSCRFFTASHETLIWARKNKKSKHTFNYKTMVDWENNYKKEIKCEKCWNKERIEILHEKWKQMRSVWAINTPWKIEKKFWKHPTQKSIELLKRIVLASTNKWDLILDPFAWSSTTWIASILFWRKFIWIDKEKDFLDLSIKRFEELDKNLKNKYK